MVRFCWHEDMSFLKIAVTSGVEQVLGIFELKMKVEVDSLQFDECLEGHLN